MLLWFICFIIIFQKTFLTEIIFFYIPLTFDTVFSTAGLRKFILASELFVLRHYFLCQLTAKRPMKILWLPVQFIFKSQWLKLQLKEENLKLHKFLVNFSKRAELVRESLLFLVYKSGFYGSTFL